jgi:rubrerythrin
MGMRLQKSGCVHFALYTVLLKSLSTNKSFLGGNIMPFGNFWTCDNCGYFVRTSGVWEYYIDKHGNRQRYGHPTPNSRAAKKAGVKGFTQEGYCPSCREEKDVIVAKFASPLNGSLEAYLAFDNPDIKHQEFPPVCDKCNTPLKDDLLNLPCPKCGIGKFKESGRFMS